ncbi:hypothetical protein LIA77_03006 [Sarocladium implicatum]|nr:hypothetical protein LIA77_03006 [Sarocladium implicatum]
MCLCKALALTEDGHVDPTHTFRPGEFLDSFEEPPSSEKFNLPHPSDNSIAPVSASITWYVALKQEPFTTYDFFVDNCIVAVQLFGNPTHLKDRRRWLCLRIAGPPSRTF